VKQTSSFATSRDGEMTVTADHILRSRFHHALLPENQLGQTQLSYSMTRRCAIVTIPQDVTRLTRGVPFTQWSVGEDRFHLQ
jgi:hypothetical protein